MSEEVKIEDKAAEMKELKAAAYDILAQIQLLQQRLQEINLNIVKLSKE